MNSASFRVVRNLKVLNELLVDQENIRSRVQQDWDSIAFTKDMDACMSFWTVITFSSWYKLIFLSFCLLRAELTLVLVLVRHAVYDIVAVICYTACIVSTTEVCLNQL